MPALKKQKLGRLKCLRYTRVLLKNIWGADVYVLARTVDVHVRKVREKIGDNYIKTVMGVGYKFDPNNE